MPSLSRTRLRDKTVGSLLSVAIGDAMGLPVEKKSPDEIRESFGYIDKFVRSPVIVSDDTQLSLAIMDSITRRRGYNKQDIGFAHVEAWQGKWGKPVGWGRTTINAVKKIKEGHEDTFIPVGDNRGSGNGPIMKIAPLAIFAVYKTLRTEVGRFTNRFNASLLKKCSEISRLTHGDARCIVAAYCHCRMIIRALQDEMPTSFIEISQLFVSDAEYAEKNINVSSPDKQKLSDRFRELITPAEAMSSATQISMKIGGDNIAFIMNSYPLVAFAVARYSPYRNLMYAITETVNAGSDTDSNASMVGAIIGAQLGFGAIPPHLVKQIQNYKTIMGAIKAFEQSL